LAHAVIAVDYERGCRLAHDPDLRFRVGRPDGQPLGVDRQPNAPVGLDAPEIGSTRWSMISRASSSGTPT
jgi:hypothetical protein